MICLSHIKQALELPQEVIHIIFSFFHEWNCRYQTAFIRHIFGTIAADKGKAEAKAYLGPACDMLRTVAIPQSIHLRVVNGLVHFQPGSIGNFLMSRSIFSLLGCYLSLEQPENAEQQLRHYILLKSREFYPIIVPRDEGKKIHHLST